MQDMLDNSVKSNTSLQKVQRKDDKDKDKKTVATGSATSKGVGINAGSVGNEDMSNTGDMRGSGGSSWGESFSSDKDSENNEDTQELNKSLDFFKRDKIYQMKSNQREDEEYEEKDEKKKTHDETEEKACEEDIKDGSSEEKVTGKKEEKDLTYKDPEHRVKDKYSSEEEKESDEERKDIVLPQIKIQSSGLTMDMPDGLSPDIVETGNSQEDMFFDRPDIYRLEDIEQKEVSEEIKKSPEYMKEQNNRERIVNMIVHCSSPDIAGRLIERLYQLGDKILDTCLAFDVKIVVLKSGEKLSHVVRNAETIGELRAGYSENLKICFLGEEWLFENFENLYRFNTPVYLMAIAFDHATGGDSFASLKSPFVLNNYHACRRGEEGHQFLEGIASYGPVEYFAQTLETFLQGKDDSFGIDMAQKVFEGKISTKDELYYTDLSMYQYIDYLVQS
jgi:hypothetical protein